MATPVWKQLANAVKALCIAETASVGLPRTVIVGWPTRNQLDAALQGDKASGPAEAPRTIISIFKPRGTWRTSSPFARKWCPSSTQPPRSITLNGDADLEELTTRMSASAPSNQYAFDLTGTPAAGEAIAISFRRYEPTVADKVAAHAVVEGDNVFDIIIDLATKINALAIPNMTAVAGPGTLTLNFSPPADALRQSEDVVIRVSGRRILVAEVARTVGPLEVNIWAPSYAARDEFTAALEAVFPTMGSQSNPNRIALANGTIAIVRPMDGGPDDAETTQKNFRYRFTLSCDVPIIETDANGVEILSTQQFLVIETIIAGTPAEAGPGAQPVDCMTCIDCVDPYFKDQLEALTIFGRPNAC